VLGSRDPKRGEPAAAAPEPRGLRENAGRGGRGASQFRLALVLAHETRHRLGALRMLSWFDVDLKARTIRWRAANDKMDFEHTTVSTAWAVAALEAARGELTEAAWGARGASADRRAGGPWRGQAAVTKLGGRSASAACPTTTRPTYSHEGRFS